MTREQEFFLQVLADHIHGRATNPPEGLDWPLIAKYAKSHEVEGIIYHQCKEYLSEHDELAAVNERLSQSSAAALFYYLNTRQAFEELKATYEREKTPFFTVKGLTVAELYPVPAFRTMGDLDIVLHSKDREKTHEALLALGYQNKTHPLVGCYHRANQSLEIHDRLVYDVDETNSSRKNFFNSCWNYAIPADNKGVYYQLDWSFHFAFLVDHLMKHFTVEGVGFRQFMDLAITAKNVELDWLWLEKHLRKCELWDFTLTALTFCNIWWGIKVPVPLKNLDISIYETSTELIFKNGVFGFDNEDHAVHATGKSIDSIKGPKRLRPVILAIKKVCKSYDEMILLPYCAFLKGKKCLLPIAWVYRVFYVALNKKGNISAERKRVFESGDILDERSEILKQWGL